MGQVLIITVLIFMYILFMKGTKCTPTMNGRILAYTAGALDSLVIVAYVLGFLTTLPVVAMLAVVCYIFNLYTLIKLNPK